MGVTNSKSILKQVKEVHSNENNSTETSCKCEIETVELPTRDIIPEEETEEDKKVNGNFSDIPITEAEKLRDIYKKEKALGILTVNGTAIKKEVKDNQRQQYKTSDYHDSGRQIPAPKIEDTKGQSVQTTVETNDKSDTENAVTILANETLGTPVITLAGKSVKRSPQFQQTAQREHGVSLRSNKSSQLIPVGPGHVKTDETSLGPLVTGKLQKEKNDIRTELAKNGILTSNAQTATEQVDPKQQGIIGELRQIGIIHKITADDVYTLSSGMPKRRPPPRLTQLPPLDKEQTTVPDTLFKNVNLFEKKVLTKDLETSKTSTEPDKIDSNSEYFGTIGKEIVGDAEKLKLKLFDVDML